MHASFKAQIYIDDTQHRATSKVAEIRCGDRREQSCTIFPKMWCCSALSVCWYFRQPWANANILAPVQWCLHCLKHSVCTRRRPPSSTKTALMPFLLCMCTLQCITHAKWDKLGEIKNYLPYACLSQGFCHKSWSTVLCSWGFASKHMGTSKHHPWKALLTQGNTLLNFALEK